MFTDPFETLSTFEKAATVALYLTIAILVLLIVIGVLVKKFKSDYAQRYVKTAFVALVGYAVGMLANLLYLKLDDYLSKGYIEYATFIPIVVLVGVSILLGVGGYMMAIFRKDKLPLYAKISLGIIGAGIVAIIVSQMVVRYKNAENIDIPSEVQLYVYTALIIAAVAIAAFVFGKKREDISNTKSLVYAAVSVAMSFALSYIRFLELPQGGSITFASLLPLMIYAYTFGIRKGVLAGALYGLLQFVQAPWFYHPVQFLLDYPIAFAAIGLTGIFKEVNILGNKKVIQFALGALVGVILRYLAHVVSGIFVFGSGDPENYNAVAWSFMYNSFAFADITVALVAGCTMFASKSFVKFIEAAPTR